MPSSLSIYSSAPKTKIIFQFLWGILDGRPNKARPSQPILKNCQNGIFTHGWNLKFLGGQMTSFEVFKNSLYQTSFIKCLRLRPSAYTSGYKWINGIKSSAHRKWNGNNQLFCMPGTPNWKCLFLLPFKSICRQCVYLHTNFGFCLTKT